MATVLNATIKLTSETSGADQVAEKFKNIGQQAKNAAVATRGIGDTLKSLQNITIGAALALPLTNFVKEAIQGQEVTARFGLQLKTLGQSINDIDIETLAKRTREFGIRETELTQALATGLKFFKDTSTEMKYMNTALGITRLTGASLETAFQQLGMVTMGYTRVARQFGVSMHTEIKDPAERAAAVLADLQKRMEGMTAPTLTAAEELKKFGATFGDIGEKIGGEFLGGIASVARSLNSMNDFTKEAVTRTVLYTGAIIGLTTAMSGLATVLKGTAFATLIGNTAIWATTAVNIKNLIPLIGAMGAEIKVAALAMAPFAASAAVFIGLAALLGIAVTKWVEYGSELKKVKAIQEETAAKSKEAASTTIADAVGEINIATDLNEVLKEQGRIRELLGVKAADARGRGDTSGEDAAKKELVLLQQRINSIALAEKTKKDLGIQTEEDLQKQYEKATKDEYDYEVDLIKKKYAFLDAAGVLAEDQRKKLTALRDKEMADADKKEVARQADLQKAIATLRIEAMADGQAKEIALVKANAEAESKTLKDDYAKSLEYKKQLAEKTASDIANINAKYAMETMDKELKLALMSSEERKQYEKDYAEAKAALDGKNVDDINRLSDEQKKILNESAGGQAALDEKRKQLSKDILETKKKEAQVQVDIAEAAKKQDEILAKWRADSEKKVKEGVNGNTGLGKEGVVLGKDGGGTIIKSQIDVKVQFETDPVNLAKVSEETIRQAAKKMEEIVNANTKVLNDDVIKHMQQVGA